MNVRSNRRYVIAIVLLGIGYFLSYSSQEWFLFRVHKDAHGMLMNVGFQWVAVLPLCSGILLCMGYATALATFIKKPVRASFPLLTSSLLLTLPYIVQFMDLYGLCFRLTGDRLNRYLQNIAERTTFQKWYMGHYHTDVTYRFFEAYPAQCVLERFVLLIDT